MAKDIRQITMADFAADISDLADVTPSVNILIYGDPGTGKTGLVSGLPNALMLACDPGWVTARAMGFRPQIRQIPNYETLQAGLAWLEDGNCSNYEWIILDGATVLQQKLLRQFCRDAWEADNNKRASAMQPDKPDYFKSQNAIKGAVARLVDLPTNVVITAHAMHGETDDGDGWVRPHFEGRDYMVGNAITALPNCIGYMYPKSTGTGANVKQHRRILWNEFQNPDTDTTYMAKDQLGVFGKYTDNLTSAEFDRLIYNAGEETASGKENGGGKVAPAKANGAASRRAPRTR